MFFDESRFGTHSKLGYGWFKTGSRSRVKINLGFKNFYVYSAVNSSSGKEFSLLMPYVNTHCMNIYLQRLAMSLAGKKCILILDGASWHKAKGLNIPKNIELIYLPPYSPELNPVERLWEYVKAHTLKNKLYTSLLTLEQAVCDFMANLSSDIIKQICSCNYL
jgi:transposase